MSEAMALRSPRFVGAHTKKSEGLLELVRKNMSTMQNLAQHCLRTHACEREVHRAMLEALRHDVHIHVTLQEDVLNSFWDAYALANLPVGFDSLQKRFRSEDWNAVKDFATAQPEIVRACRHAAIALRQYFPTNAMSLNLFPDVEGEDLPTFMVLSVHVPFDDSSAIEKLGRFDQLWDHIRDPNLCVNLLYE